MSQYEYDKKKKELPEEEFSLRYFINRDDYNNSTTYYEIVSDNPTESEHALYLLNEILLQQKEIARKTSIISGIVIFSLICSIIPGIILAAALL